MYTEGIIALGRICSHQYEMTVYPPDRLCIYHNILYILICILKWVYIFVICINIYEILVSVCGYIHVYELDHFINAYVNKYIHMFMTHRHRHIYIGRCR